MGGGAPVCPLVMEIESNSAGALLLLGGRRGKEEEEGSDRTRPDQTRRLAPNKDRAKSLSNSTL